MYGQSVASGPYGREQWDGLVWDEVTSVKESCWSGIAELSLTNKGEHVFVKICVLPGDSSKEKAFFSKESSDCSCTAF